MFSEVFGYIIYKSTSRVFTQFQLGYDILCGDA